MSNKSGNLQKQLSQRGTLVGVLQMRPNPLLVELAEQCGYHFLLLDGEHGVFAEEDFRSGLKALATTGVLSMVRLAQHDPQALTRYLDMGADAIVVPHVSTAEEARRMVRAMAAKEDASLIVIIESVLGVSNAEEILAIEGVDGAMVGPNDLTADMGCPGDYAQSAYEQALSRIERAAVATGKFLGTAPHGDYSLETLLARGHRLFVLGADLSIIREALHAQMTKVRSCL